MLTFIKRELVSNFHAVELLITASDRQLKRTDVNISAFISKLSEGLKNDSFLAMQKVGFFRSLNSDECFNHLFKVYTKIDQTIHSTYIMVVDDEEFKQGKPEDVKLWSQTINTNCKMLKINLADTIIIINKLLLEINITMKSENEDDILKFKTPSDNQ